jgi:hypothetical protein
VSTILTFRPFADVRGIPVVVFVDMQQEYVVMPQPIGIPEIDSALANSRMAIWKRVEHADLDQRKDSWRNRLGGHHADGVQ